MRKFKCLREESFLKQSLKSWNASLGCITVTQESVSLQSSLKEKSLNEKKRELATDYSAKTQDLLLRDGAIDVPEQVPLLVLKQWMTDI